MEGERTLTFARANEGSCVKESVFNALRKRRGKLRGSDVAQKLADKTCDNVDIDVYN